MGRRASGPRRPRMPIRSPFFRQATDWAVTQYCRHFGDRLVAVYVCGSVHRNEAVPEISDLDLHAFIRDPCRELDIQWCEQTQQQMDQIFPSTEGLRRPRPADVIRRGLQPEADPRAHAIARALGFRLRYDATLVWGQDLLTGLSISVPDSRWVQAYFQSSWDLTRYAAGLLPTNPTDFTLPDALPLRVRKLARLAVLGGACLLMVRGQFRSFCGTEVIPTLREAEPAWREFLGATQTRYIHVTNPRLSQVAAYLAQLVTWMEWIGTTIEEVVERR